MSLREGINKYGRCPAVFTFQKEVAEGLGAPLNHKERSRLSIMCQSFAQVNYLMTIPGKFQVSLLSTCSLRYQNAFRNIGYASH